MCLKGTRTRQSDGIPPTYAKRFFFQMCKDRGNKNITPVHSPPLSLLVVVTPFDVLAMWAGRFVWFSRENWASFMPQRTSLVLQGGGGAGLLWGGGGEGMHGLAQRTFPFCSLILRRRSLFSVCHFWNVCSCRRNSFPSKAAKFFSRRAFFRHLAAAEKNKTKQKNKKIISGRV